MSIGITGLEQAAVVGTLRALADSIERGDLTLWGWDQDIDTFDVERFGEVPERVRSGKRTFTVTTMGHADAGDPVPREAPE